MIREAMQVWGKRSMEMGTICIFLATFLVLAVVLRNKVLKIFKNKT
jgi:hypothetical protein